jgi:hypothetical protein
LFAYIATGALRDSPPDYILGISHVVTAALLLVSVVLSAASERHAAAVAATAFILTAFYGVFVYVGASLHVLGLAHPEDVVVFSLLWIILGAGFLWLNIRKSP